MHLLDAARVRALAAACRLPDRAVRRLVRVPAEVDGQPLDLRTRWFLTLLRLDRGRHHEDPPAVQRELLALVDRALAGPPRAVPITTLSVPLPGRTLTARVYRGVEGRGAPALLYLHGGGFVLGDPEGYDRFCSRLAQEGGCVVVSLAYRLAPEHPFPAAVEDVVAAWHWLRAEAPTLGLDRHRLAVGGDSAGGNLSAVLSNEAGRAAAPAFQLLVYPAVDMLGDRPAKRLFAEGYHLTAAHVDWFSATYLPDRARWADPRASPLYAPAPAPVPTILLVAGLDPLRDDGLAYAERLRAAGTPVDLVTARGLPHGFVSLDAILPEADAAVADLCARVKLRW